MKRLALVAASVALFACPLADAIAADPVARFEGGIGSQPLASNGTATIANAVLGVNPGGRPWVIKRLVAEARDDGRIRVDGRGLLLAGGDGIATPGGQSVRARLFCDGDEHDSEDAAELDENGDFRIDSHLTKTPPNPCNRPVLLIVNVPQQPTGTPVWFAAGIPKR